MCLEITAIKIVVGLLGYLIDKNKTFIGFLYFVAITVHFL